MNNAFCTLKRNYLEGKIVINIIPTLSVMDTYDDYNTMIKNYIKSNSNLFRCNTTRFDNNTYIKSIHTLQEIYYTYMGEYFNLLLDIPCPQEKIRIQYKSKQNEIKIEKNQKIIITNDKNKLDNGMIFANIPISSVMIGERVILGDGDLLLRVDSKSKSFITCTSLNGRKIGIGKALYTESFFCNKSCDAIVNSSIKLIEKLKPSHIALSFVENVEDIVDFKSKIRKIPDYSPIIISKIETKKAVDNISELINETPNIMIARGDLALSAGYEWLYKCQNEIIKKCNLLISNEKIFIASEIMNSLVDSVMPKRSEVCDLSNIIEKGIRNIILSGPLCRYDNYNIAANYINQIYKIYS